MVRSLSLFEPAFDRENKIFGNKDGITMEKDRRSLAGQVEEQNQRILDLSTKLDTAHSDIWPIRQSILDGETDIADRNTRNETAYGGHLLADVEFIKFMEKIDLARANLWKRKFNDLYAINFTHRNHISYDSVEVLNIYATIRTVRPWATDKSLSHSTAVSQCEDVIRTWVARQDEKYWKEETTRNLVEEIRFYYRRKLYGF